MKRDDVRTISEDCDSDSEETVSYDYATRSQMRNEEYVPWLREMVQSEKRGLFRRGVSKHIKVHIPRHWHPRIVKAILAGRDIDLDKLHDNLGRPIHCRGGVTHIPYESGLDFLKWFYPDHEVRYPTPDEWKRAWRGNDARPFPSGEYDLPPGTYDWRTEGYYGPYQVMPNDQPHILDRSPFSTRSADGALLTSVTFLVSGTFSYVTNNDPERFMPPVGLRPEQADKVALLAGLPYTCQPPQGVEALQAIGRDEVTIAGIIPTIRLKNAPPTPDIETLTQ
jgi:hypothetical protein